MDKARRRALGHGGNGTRDRGHIRPRLDRGKHERHSCLALAFQHANCALPMLNQRCCGEGGAVSADADKGPGKARLCCLRQIDDLRDICQIVAGERDDVWPPDVEQPEIRRGDPRPADRSAAQCGRRSAPPRQRAQARAAPAAKTPWCREGDRDGYPEAAPELLPWKLSAEFPSFREAKLLIRRGS